MVAHESTEEVQSLKMSREGKLVVTMLFYLDSGELGGGGVIFTGESVLYTWVSSSSKRTLF